MRITKASELLALDSGNYNTSVTTDIANLTALDPREAPGVITVITAEEIAASGARDLQEALTLVPGITLGRDLDDVVSISIRGNWAEEGKCLVMLNGVFLNEFSYGTFALGQRIPLGNVSRIEVISGPGSVIYGGFAALGVVNIITKDTREFEGGGVVAQVGTANGFKSRLNAQVFGSYLIGPKTEMSYSIYSGIGVPTAERALLPDGRELSYGDSSAFESHQFTVALRTPRTYAQIFFNEREAEVSDASHALVQRDLLMDMEHTLPLGDRLKLTLRSQYRNQRPWNWVNDPATAYTGTTDQRLSQMVRFQYEIRPWLGLNTGLSAFTEVSRYRSRAWEFSATGNRELRANDAALFCEATVSKKWGTTTIGARAERHTFSDKVLIAPRFAWTKAWRYFHAKMLYSVAYRLPTFQNIEIGPPDHRLKNEWVYTTEAEVGWRSGTGTELAMNVFRVDIHQPIVYVYAEGVSENYISRDRAGTAGVEIKVKRSSRSLFMTICYGNYQVVRSKSSLPEVELPAPYDLSYQSVPRHKVTLVAAWKAAVQFSLETRTGWHSAAWSYQYLTEAADVLELVEHPGSLIADGGVRYRPKQIPGFSARLGLRNILGQRTSILSPYATGLLPIPLNKRELTLELHYSIGR